jgi:hypothetical protein
VTRLRLLAADMLHDGQQCHVSGLDVRYEAAVWALRAGKGREVPYLKGKIAKRLLCNISTFRAPKHTTQGRMLGATR